MLLIDFCIVCFVFVYGVVGVFVWFFWMFVSLFVYGLLVCGY